MPMGCHVTPGVLQELFLDALMPQSFDVFCPWHPFSLDISFFFEIKFTSTAKCDQKRRDGVNKI